MENNLGQRCCSKLLSNFFLISPNFSLRQAKLGDKITLIQRQLPSTFYPLAAFWLPPLASRCSASQSPLATRRQPLACERRRPDSKLETVHSATRPLCHSATLLLCCSSSAPLPLLLCFSSGACERRSLDNWLSGRPVLLPLCSGGIWANLQKGLLSASGNTRRLARRISN